MVLERPRKKNNSKVVLISILVDQLLKLTPTNNGMQKFLVLYKMPLAGFDDWMKTDPAIRKEAEEKMQREWQEWGQANKAAIIDTAGAGKTKLVNKDGTSDIKNDIMLYSIVEATSIDEALKMFEGHPHLGIPNASIEIMPSNSIPGMTV
jgi:hypothetical protein